jgi:hypothetical protein
MTNERLRAAFSRAGVSEEAAAREAGVDRKTVQRWISGRVPHPGNRRTLSLLVDEDEHFLWPRAREADVAANDATSEIVTAFSHRTEFPIHRWWELFSSVTDQLDLLGYTLFFLPQQHPQLAELLIEKARDGCQIRLLIADPESEQVRLREAEERQAITIGIRIQSTLDWLNPLLDCDGIEVGFQVAPLYNSVFRFDDQMLVTPHLFATPGHSAPLFRLRRLGEQGLFERFAGHFEAIWAARRPMGQDRGERPLRSGA